MACPEPKVPREMSETEEVFCVGPYETTVNEHIAFTTENIKILKNSCEKYTFDQLRDEFQDLGLSEKMSVDSANDIIVNKVLIKCNDSGEAGDQSKIKRLGDRYVNQKDEKILMLEFPLTKDEREQRDTESRNYIQKYLGDKNDSRVKYEPVSSYLHLNCCQCGGSNSSVLGLPGQTTPEIDIMHQDACMAKVIHPFLHDTCQNALLIQIVYNGHGSEEGLCVHEDKHVKLDYIIEDVTQCFKSIPHDMLPIQIDIIFPQCHGDRYTGAKSAGERMVVDPDIPPEKPTDKTITVTHLVKCKFTWSIRGYHLHLQDYADKRKAAVQGNPQENPASDISTHSTKTEPREEASVTGEAQGTGPQPSTDASTLN